MKTAAFGLLAVALLISGCGGGSSTSTPLSAAAAQLHFSAPQDFHQLTPGAPPDVVPRAPTAEQLAKVVALREFVRTRPSSGLAGSTTSSSSPNPIVRLTTSLGNIDVELRPDAAPNNVVNFMSYVSSGAYSSTSFIHRSVPGFIIQGGGYYFSDGQVDAIPQQPPVVNEFKLSNVRGTLAMAKVNSNPNSATSQWFFNLADNSASLNSQGGGSTVIGAIVNTDGLAVMDAIAALQIINAGSPFDALPVLSNYTTGASVTQANVVLSPITVLASHPSFFNGEQNVGNAVQYLAFSNGNFFGYYSYLEDESYIYHFDLGYEYLFDANDGRSGVYLYDFASNSFFYTSPTFPFPYMYDFSLNSVVYYYPDTGSANHYTTNPRYFYEFETASIITL